MLWERSQHKHTSGLRGRMTESERWAYLTALDEELLVGGVVLSEWTSEIVRQSDVALVHSAPLASILTAVAAIESQLRAEAGAEAPSRLIDLINEADLADELRAELHRLRRYRNRWVHVNDPWNDEPLLVHLGATHAELEEVALDAARLLRRVLYSDRWT